MFILDDKSKLYTLEQVKENHIPCNTLRTIIERSPKFQTSTLKSILRSVSYYVTNQ